MTSDKGVYFNYYAASREPCEDDEFRLPEVNVMVLLTVQIEVMNKAALHLVQ